MTLSPVALALQRDNLKCLIVLNTFDLIVVLAFGIIQFIIYGLTGGATCDQPLNMHVLIMASLNLARIPIKGYLLVKSIVVLSRCLNDYDWSDIYQRPMAYVDYMMFAVQIVWVGWGAFWIFTTKACSTDARLLYQFSNVFFYIFSTYLIVFVMVFVNFYRYKLAVIRQTRVDAARAQLETGDGVRETGEETADASPLEGRYPGRSVKYNWGSEPTPQAIGGMELPKLEVIEDCIICLGPFEQDQSVTILECGHAHHTACWNLWLRQYPVCPLRCSPHTPSMLIEHMTQSLHSLQLEIQSMESLHSVLVEDHGREDRREVASQITQATRHNTNFTSASIHDDEGFVR